MGPDLKPSAVAWMTLNRRKRAAKLVESKLEVAEKRNQKSINLPIEDARALLTAIRD